jgi:hypothetical protein
MAKHCTNCGHELREGDKFCAECGTPAVEGMAARSPTNVHWEYRDLVIPLNLRTNASDAEQAELRAKVDRIVLTQLQQVAKEGWEPEGRTDYGTLLETGQLRWRSTSFFRYVWVYDSVTLRLRRRVQS